MPLLCGHCLRLPIGPLIYETHAAKINWERRLDVMSIMSIASYFLSMLREKKNMA